MNQKASEEPTKKGRKVLGIVLKCAAALAVTVFLLAFLCPLPFHKEYKCIQIWLRDPTYKREVTVRFDGFYHLNLFKDDSFSGTMTSTLHFGPSNDLRSSVELSEIPLNKGKTYLYYRQIPDDSAQGFASSDPDLFKDTPPDAGEYVFCGGRMDAQRFLKGFAYLTCDVMSTGHEDWNGRGWVWDGVCTVPDCTDYESARAYLQEMGSIPLD